MLFTARFRLWQLLRGHEATRWIFPPRRVSIFIYLFLHPSLFTSDQRTYRLVRRSLVNLHYQSCRNPQFSDSGHPRVGRNLDLATPVARLTCAPNYLAIRIGLLVIQSFNPSLYQCISSLSVSPSLSLPACSISYSIPSTIHSFMHSFMPSFPRSIVRSTPPTTSVFCNQLLGPPRKASIFSTRSSFSLSVCQSISLSIYRSVGPSIC